MYTTPIDFVIDRIQLNVAMIQAVVLYKVKMCLFNHFMPVIKPISQRGAGHRQKNGQTTAVQIVEKIPS